jgi:hypothetical protein
MLNSFYLILFFILKKIPPTFVRVENRFLQNCPPTVSKEAQFCAASKKVHISFVKLWQESCFTQKQIFYFIAETVLFKNFLGYFFENCASFDSLFGHFERKNAQLLEGSVLFFLQDKRSNQTIEHIRNVFL